MSALLRDRIAIVAVVGLAIAVRLEFTSFTVDDAYITLRYAENLAHGRGFVFNAGERVYGTTTPLFTFILASLKSLIDDPLVLGKALNAVSDAMMAVLLCILAYRFSRRRWAAGLAGVIYALNPTAVSWSAMGMETGFYTLCIGLTFWSYARQRVRWAYVCAGLACVTRVDGFLAFAVLLAFDVWRRRSRVLGDVWLGALPVAVWSAFAWHYFGSALPHSALAKEVTYGARPFLDVLQQVATKHLFRHDVASVAAALPAAVGLIWVLPHERYGRPMLVWWLVYWAFFIVGGARLHGWYMAPPVWVYTLATALGLERIVAVVVSRTRLQRSGGQWLLAAALVSLALIVSGILVRHRYREVASTIGSFEEHVSRPVGLWLKSHAAQGDTVCLESIGAVGYYSGLYVLDEVGLVSPGVVPLNRLVGGGPNFGAIVRTFSPKYYVWWESWEQRWWESRPEQRAWLDSAYAKMARFAVPGDMGWAIWKRRERAQISGGSLPSVPDDDRRGIQRTEQ